ncbi:tRNA wybutosine-synthesizing protein [Lachnellula suecica]|uniref:tRNA(Phe) 7-[(3-amino-3-carboxypropyl)-4-demethylwyosine(37)-N(4)]-methyltransferase n=1 Tax=Lachnellula suecica TaxID=602035 RepID=A0A8T9BW24_9HELO|nr:tRNA wybutosine-synthesizing protein [Lachnellula suecica]
MQPQPPPLLPPSFLSKKSRILSALAVPAETYDDLSPKGSVDEGIRELIGEINALDACVTTSSCAGRVSVFLEGKKGKDVWDGEEGGSRETKAGVGGKGGGGRWLYVSHDPVDISHASDLATLLGMQRVDDAVVQGSSKDLRFIHFKFEPMILHILTASLQQAQTVLSAALQAGFRESGALNLISPSEQATPMVGIRSMGLALESLVGFEDDGREICMVPEWQLKTLLEISNERFVENTKRIERFRKLLGELGVMRGKEGEGWEDPQVRRERKRAEGLKRSQESKKAAVDEDNP